MKIQSYFQWQKGITAICFSIALFTKIAMAATAPGAPKIGAATAGSTTATVAFTAPSSTGGATISSYTASCVTGSGSAAVTTTATGTASPITVLRLTNGLTYACSVKATNASKLTSVASSVVSVVPGTTPGAPKIGTATGGNTTASVAFTAPSATGGSAISLYTASCLTGSGDTAVTKTATGTVSPIVVLRLTNGATYACSVKATNASKLTSVASSVTSVVPGTVPGAPTIGTGTAGNTTASIAFTAPSATGIAAITGYTASCVTGTGVTAVNTTATGTTSPITVLRLTNGSTYACSVKATNASNLTSVASGSVSVVPGTAPGAPTIGVATANSGAASIAFTAPTSTGSSALTGYTATCVSGSGATAVTKTGTATSSPISVSSLTNGLTYACTVKATNASKLTSVASGSVSVNPGIAGAPTIGSVLIGNGSAKVYFTAPSSNGGSAITGYTAYCVIGSVTKTGTGTSSPITVSGLTNGTSYACSVKATNSTGIGSASTASSVTPSASTTTVPGTPTLNSLTAGAAQISVAFAKASTGATPTSYTATCASNSSSVSVSGTSTTVIVAGLTAGTGYACTVTAYTATAFSAASNSISTTTSNAVTYSTPSNFKTLVENTFTPSTTLTSSSSVTNRYRYMISDASAATTSSNYLSIGDTYNASTGYGVTSGRLSSSSTYKDYLRKTIQFVQDSSDTAGTYFRLDSHLHPNNSLDVDSNSADLMKFRNNFGKATTTYGYVTFSYNSTTKLLTARKRYTYSYALSTATTPYLASYTASTTYTNKYLSYSSSTGTYSLSTTGTPFYLYATPLSLDIPTVMNTQGATTFSTVPAAPFKSKTSVASVEGATGPMSIYDQLSSTYKPQVTYSGTHAETKTAATSKLAEIKEALSANGESLRYSTDVYTAFRDALLATTLVSDSIADGAPGQNLVPYVYFTNEYETTSTGARIYHPFMVIVSYGNQASPNGLKDVLTPPGATISGTTYVTRFSNIENHVIPIAMKDYGQVSALTDNTFSSSSYKNLYLDSVTTETPSTLSKIGSNVYTWADSADNGILVDGSVMFPLFNNALYPSPMAAELTASGCHVGQGGGGPHCHADGYQSGQGLTLYNDTDYTGKTHPPLIGFGNEGIALFGRYRSTDTGLLGYSTALDGYGAHTHDSIGYHYHAHTLTNFVAYPAPSRTATTVTELRVLMKGAYIGKTSNIPYFRSNSTFSTNKYLGGK
jgi:hypothetical protein